MARLRKPIRPILNTGTTRRADRYRLNGPGTLWRRSKIIEIHYRWTVDLRNRMTWPISTDPRLISPASASPASGTSPDLRLANDAR